MYVFLFKTKAGECYLDVRGGGYYGLRGVVNVDFSHGTYLHKFISEFDSQHDIINKAVRRACESENEDEEGIAEIIIENFEVVFNIHIIPLFS